MCYLYMKTIERAAFPARHWEKVKLSRNYKKGKKYSKLEYFHWSRHGTTFLVSLLFIFEIKTLEIFPSCGSQKIFKRNEKRSQIKSRFHSQSPINDDL